MLREVRASGLLGARTEHAVAAMGVDELIARTSEVARANVLDVVDVDADGSFRFSVVKARDKGLGHLIKSLRHDAESGAPIIELYPADGARAQLGKWIGAEKAPAAPAPVVNVAIVLAQLSPDALQELSRALSPAPAIETIATEDDA